MLFMLTACNDLLDDLSPSSSDKRTEVVPGSLGYQVSQLAPDMSLFNTVSTPVTLSAEIATADAVVLYFTMWCPVCDTHMSDMRSNVIPSFASVKFYFVDYVSGTVSNARIAQVSNGYVSTAFDVLVDDANHTAVNLFNGTMGTTVVIDNTGIIQMNEDYKDGSKLITVLTERVP